MSIDLEKLKKEDLKQIIKSEKMGLISGKNKSDLIKIITDFRNKSKSSSSSSSSRKTEKVNIYVGSQPHQEAVSRSYASQYTPSTTQSSSSTDHTPNLSNKAINPIQPEEIKGGGLLGFFNKPTTRLGKLRQKLSEILDTDRRHPGDEKRKQIIEYYQMLIEKEKAKSK